MKTQKQFKNSKPYLAACSMPPGLSHHPDRSQPFNITQSEVVSWLIQQPDILAFIFSKASQSGAIKFDIPSQTWAGINP